ncbi:XRE family transcriptional regulator [Desulfosporosinus sp. Sb-LF]|nr:XRE family transcriptional regulator [Desulfosporosinus sp. Sb-LF]
MIRRKHRLTQKELAKLLQISQGNVSKIEKGNLSGNILALKLLYLLVLDKEELQEGGGIISYE